MITHRLILTAPDLLAIETTTATGDSLVPDPVQRLVYRRAPVQEPGSNPC